MKQEQLKLLIHSIEEEQIINKAKILLKERIRPAKEKMENISRTIAHMVQKHNGDMSNKTEEQITTLLNKGYEAIPFEELEDELQSALIKEVMNIKPPMSDDDDDDDDDEDN